MTNCRGTAYDAELLEKISRMELLLRGIESDADYIAQELRIFDDNVSGPALDSIALDSESFAQTCAREIENMVTRNNSRLLPLLAASTTLLTRC